MNVTSFAVRGGTIFAGTFGSGVFLSTNNGTSWSAVGLSNSQVLSVTVMGSIIFVGTLDGGIFLSKDNGTSWSAVDSGLTNLDIRSLVVSGRNMFQGHGVMVFSLLTIAV